MIKPETVARLRLSILPSDLTFVEVRWSRRIGHPMSPSRAEAFIALLWDAAHEIAGTPGTGVGVPVEIPAPFAIPLGDGPDEGDDHVASGILLGVDEHAVQRRGYVMELKLRPEIGWRFLTPVPAGRKLTVLPQARQGFEKRGLTKVSFRIDLR